MNKSTFHFFLGILILFSLVWLGWREAKIHGADWLPVNYVRIEGAFQYIAKDKIKQVLQEQVNKGLYNVDIQQIKQSVQQLPWVEKVNVERIWPDIIDIKIIEQIPVVRWGEKGLLNKKSELFEPDNMNKFNQLPMLMGTVGQEIKLLEIMQNLSRVLIEQQMKLSAFHVNKRGAWHVSLENGMKLVAGSHQPLEKIRRFLRTFTLIGEQQIANIISVDLRYPYGYALTWKSGEEPINWKEIAEIRKI